MLTAVWVAVIVAVVFWAALVSVAVFVMLKSARLITQATVAVADLHERGDALFEQASAVTRRADEQVGRAAAITASMEDVSATMTELNGALATLAPAARTIADGVGGPLIRVAALVYGVRRAVGMRRPERPARLRLLWHPAVPATVAGTGTPHQISPPARRRAGLAKRRR